MKLNHITNPQSGGGQRINADAALLNQSGGDGTDFRDKPAVRDSRSCQLQETDKCELSMTKIELTALCTLSNLISCAPVSCKKICNGS